MSRPTKRQEWARTFSPRREERGNALAQSLSLLAVDTSCLGNRVNLSGGERI